jgi:Low affinity iron permease
VPGTPVCTRDREPQSQRVTAGDPTDETAPPLAQGDYLVLKEIAAVSVVVWIATGPLFHWSDTWQLVMNTVSSIVTFLMVFLPADTQTT